MTKPTQQLIEDAIKGGWEPQYKGMTVSLADCVVDSVVYFENAEWGEGIPFATVLLSAAFWQAVGKTRGWEDDKEIKAPRLGAKIVSKGEWYHVMHRMIDHLAAGKSLESFIQSL